MLLLDLPTELLLLIFSFLGPEYFRSNLRHLTIASKWYNAAVDILSGYFYQDWGRPAMFRMSNAACERLKSKLRTARVEFGLYACSLMSASDFDAYTRLDVQARLDKRSSSKKLVDVLGECRQLRSLDICIILTDGDPDNVTFVGHQSLFPLLSLSNLTSLVLSYQYPLKGDMDLRAIPCEHFCSAANALFPTLRRFFYRMPTVCKDLLDLEKYPELPAMEEMIIGLRHRSCLGGSPAVMSLECAPPGEKPGEVVKPKQFEALARKFADRLPNAKVLLITSNQLLDDGGHRVREYDALKDAEQFWLGEDVWGGTLWFDHDSQPSPSLLEYYYGEMEKLIAGDRDELTEENDELTDDGDDEDSEESGEGSTEEDGEDDADDADSTSQE
ncbi:uncharacterized protein E0L32_007566 [Thyridium curvatum]|uniref:F-box domain-containing protein n=1 Tax=Thyridium curvatum TaxID=1093900 RepID=A0A507B3E4_9PEZI|nr:uncharacterized protein E0L32_007566 [Thyridium curvatum]TPX11829.1 hypothetical protein E0L32_007566 [Thyridium curvatum]